jgi:hypothetical protein
MSRAGDSADYPSRLSRNTVLRPGPQLEARGAWRIDFQLPSTFFGIERLIHAVLPTREILIAQPLSGQVGMSGATGRPVYGRNDDGTWSTLPNDGQDTSRVPYASDLGANGYCVAFDKLYAFASSYFIDAPHLYRAWSYDGTAVDMQPFDTDIYGAVAVSAIRRIFIAHPKITIGQLLTPPNGFAYEGGGWTLSGCTVTTSTSRATSSSPFDATLRTLTFTSTTGYIESPVITAVSAQAPFWITVQQHFLPQYTADVPITISLINNADGSVIGSKPLIVAKRGPDTEWIRPGLSVEVPPGVAFKVRVSAGTADTPLSSTGATLGLSIAQGTSDATEYTRGTLVTNGRFFFTRPGINSMSTMIPGSYLEYEEYPDRVIWCETDSPRWWRAENFEEMHESPGAIVAAGTGAAGVAFFKKRGMWIYKFTDNKDKPLQYFDYMDGYGCLGVRAITSAFGKLYWLDDSQLYEWDFSSEPKKLVPSQLRSYLFDRAARSSNPLVAVREDTSEIVVQIRDGKQHVLNLDTGGWTEWESFTDNTQTTRVSLIECAYAQPSGASTRTLWAAYGRSVVCYDEEAASDRWVPTTTLPDEQLYAAAVEHRFTTIRSPHPRQMLTVDSVTLSYINNGSTAVPMAVEFSRDNGLTWSTSNATAPGAGATYAADDALEFTVAIRATGRRVMIRVRGNAPASSFRLVGAQADVRARGPAQRVISGT